jgi:hypothetical protein
MLLSNINNINKRRRGLNESKYVTQALKGPLNGFVEEKERGHNISVVEDNMGPETHQQVNLASSV